MVSNKRLLSPVNKRYIIMGKLNINTTYSLLLFLFQKRFFMNGRTAIEKRSKKKGNTVNKGILIFTPCIEIIDCYIKINV